MPKAALAPPVDISDGAFADYVALLKPRVMSLVVFTAFIGLIRAPSEMHPILALAALLLIAVGAGAAAALNMALDADIDALMARTRHRPIPRGRLMRDDALQFGLWLAGLSVMCLGVMINYTSAALLALTIFFYAVVYTIWLKRRTAQNIVIGGAAGALPPLIGWAASGHALTLEPFLLFAIIFFWTPPHFWALALDKHDDYRAAGVPMLPVVAGAAATRAHILAYSLPLAVASLLPFYFGFLGAAYFVGALWLNLGFIGGALWLAARPSARLSRWLFAYSIFYLFALFALMPLDAAMGGGYGG